MMHFIFNTQPIPPFLLFPLPSSTFQFHSVPLYLSQPPPSSSLLCPLPPNLLTLPFISCLDSPRLSRCVCFPSACSRGVFKQKMNKVLPEGTDAGLKGANSSVGGCRPCEGSRVLAGEAGVWRRLRMEEKTRQIYISRNIVGILLGLGDTAVQLALLPVDRTHQTK